MAEAANTPGPGFALCRLAGSLSIESAQKFEKEMRAHLTAGNHWLAIDMAHVTYVDSMWIGALLRIMFAAKERGAQLRLACVQGRILNEFRTAGIDKTFLMYPTLDEALTK
jgi:anti-anti-sigma factor